MSSDEALDWQEIRSLEQLFALEEQWRVLSKTCQAALFNCPNWLALWSEQFWDKHCELYCMAGFANGKLVVLAPFYTRSSVKLFGITKLFLLGQGEPECAELASEYPDILVNIDYLDEASKVLAEWLTALKCDVFAVRAVIQQSMLHRLIKHLPYVQTVHACRYSLQPAQWSIQQLSRNARSQWRRAEKALAEQGAEFKWLTQSEIEQYWPTMAEFHQSRWKSKGKLGAFADQRFMQFHQQFRQQHPGSVAMSGVFIGQQPLALNFYLLEGQQLHFYQSGWDDKHYSQCSPGFALHVWSILNCKDMLYDFMMGATAQSYKAKFSCEETNLVNLSLINSPWRIRLFKLVDKIL
ncbi:GNAT family N-acetyltransferase [Agarivorans aestuarii]|uniref:GNAT family N-acetyltransferase n=1 Tax=Agarivorans aestuarii TaxID=1563703 RepID=A0ABU7G7T9_9ALTE|nr:GNAT family N-acetyltransferase [Agarivorans aestuarii]MEE1675368.1 GNAT family N-acetyltransferase [Agarivorans aestuarii]